MIFYFSGTGNTKWAAEQIGSLLKEEIVDIANADTDQSFDFSDDEMVGIIFPVYAWREPAIVTDFVKRLNINGAFTFAVCTCGDEAGYSIRHLAKSIPINSAYSIIMPNNYLLMKNSDVDSENVAQDKIKNAQRKIKEICNNLDQKKGVMDVLVGSSPGLKSNIISPLFNRFSRKTKPFVVDADACIGCGLCQMICPSRAITLKDGHPSWIKKECHQCLGCLNRCPVRAIDYGDVTKSKGRYSFKEPSK